MDNQLHRSLHCVYSINYHLVWIPRYRKKVLGGPIADRLKILLAEIASQYGFELLAAEVMPEHVHLFVSAPPKFSPAEVVRYFKGISSRRLKQEFDYLRRQYWGEHATLWAEGYYVGTAGHVSAETIKHYIEHSQKA
jgi:putative transposase